MSENITENNQDIKVNQLKKPEYDENGLVKGVQYFYNELGGIDWKKMIPPKFLYVNNDPRNRARIEKKYGKNYDEIDPIKDNVEDVDLIQTLGAAKYLLRLKGFLDIKYNIKEANENYAAVNCRIVFRGDYENQNQPFTFEDNACAHNANTNGFGQKYLLEMASNRAFVRCVRNALSISVVNKEELGGVSDDSSASVQDNSKQSNLLVDLMEKKHVSWENLVMKFKSEGIYNENWKKVSDLPKDILFQMIERLKKAKL